MFNYGGMYVSMYNYWLSLGKTSVPFSHLKMPISKAPLEVITKRKNKPRRGSNKFFLHNLIPVNRLNVPLQVHKKTTPFFYFLFYLLTPFQTFMG